MLSLTQIHPNNTRPRDSTTVPHVHKLSQRLDPAILDQLAADYQAGVPTTQLMKTYGLGKGTVLRVLASRGVKMRWQPLAHEQIALAIEHYQAGWSLMRIGTELGVDHTSIHRALQRAGVQMRKPWERA